VGTAHRDVGATGRASLPPDIHIPLTVQAVLAASTIEKDGQLRNEQGQC